MKNRNRFCLSAICYKYESNRPTITNQKKLKLKIPFCTLTVDSIATIETLNCNVVKSKYLFGPDKLASRAVDMDFRTSEHIR